MAIRIVAIGLLLVVLSASLHDSRAAAQPSTTASKPPPVSTEQATDKITVPTGPDITIALVDPDEKIYVWEALRLQVSLVSGSLPSGIGVKSLTLSVPNGMALRRTGTSTSGTSIVLTPSAFTLGPGERREFPPVELDSARLPLLSSEFSSVLTYRPRKEVLVATLEYESLVDKRPGTKTTKLLVDVKANPLGMYAGGILGSLLVAIFLILPPIGVKPQAAGVILPASSPAQKMRELSVRFLRGAVVTAIAILVLQTTSDFTLPINITVHDFYGGVLLGLFGDKLAETLQKWILG